jgi:ABC-type sugar transport system ATPase subunit
VSLTVRPGEIVAVTGGIGSGTSALADALAGAVPLQSGRLEIAGAAVRSRRSAARTVAFLPSDRKRRGLLLERSVADNIALGHMATGRRWFLRPGKVRSRAVRVSEAAGIKTTSVDVAVRTLSGGNQQKTILGRWLDAGSRVLVVDEPTAGIDIAAKFEIYGLLRSLASQGAAVIVCTTDFQEVPQVADRVLVMRDGRIVGACGVDEATEHHLIELEMAG